MATFSAYKACGTPLREAKNGIAVSEVLEGRDDRQLSECVEGGSLGRGRADVMASTIQAPPISRSSARF